MIRIFQYLSDKKNKGAKTGDLFVDDDCGDIRMYECAYLVKLFSEVKMENMV